MALPTRWLSPRSRSLFPRSLSRLLLGAGAAPVLIREADDAAREDWIVARLARRVHTATPETRVGVVAEMLRASPYRRVPVVDAFGRLVGVVGEPELIGVFWPAPRGGNGEAARQTPIAEVMTAPPETLAPEQRLAAALARFQETGRDTLPVVDEYGMFQGFLAQSDLVQDLARPFRPPVVGGMATPLGVYLTTGTVSGGSGGWALVLSGLLLFGVHLAAEGVSAAGIHGARTILPDGAWSRPPLMLRESLENLVPALIQLFLFLGALRLSPIAGYHAAEHQVVHALERSEPLLVENVRRMPRVHPRCGTNLVAGVFLLITVGLTLYPFIGDFGFLAGAVSALAYWRILGAWLQERFTTRPATDRQIASGIAAARQVLERHNRQPYAAVHPLRRIWRMGLLQSFCGFAIGYLLLTALDHFVPPLHPFLAPLLEPLL